MHTEFDPSKIDWGTFITKQQNIGESRSECLNGLIQFGTGVGGGAYSVFAGLPYQRGAGVGSLFRSLLHYLIPIGREAGLAIGRQGLVTGAKVLNNVLDGGDLKTSLVDESRSGLKQLLDKASNNLSRQSGNGSGGSFDFKRYKKLINKDGGAGGGSIGFGGIPKLGMDEAIDRFPINHQKTINKKLRRAFHKPSRKQFRSIVGPPIIPTTTTSRFKKSSIESPSPSSNIKRLRVDSLGVY